MTVTAVVPVYIVALLPKYIAQLCYYLPHNSISD